MNNSLLSVPTLRKRSMPRVLCMYLLQIGMCFKKDLTLIGKQFGTEQKTSETISQLVKCGYITEIIIQGKKKRPSIAMSLTRSGRIALLNKFYDEGNGNWSDDDSNINAINDFRTTSEEILIQRLTESSIKTLLFVCNIAIFKKDKPDLYDLYTTLRHNQLNNENKRNEMLSTEKAYEYLNQGIYYSMKEIREFTNKINKEDDLDTFYGSRAKGIVITDTNCYVIYAQRYQSDTMIKLASTTETRLIDNLSPLLRYTNVYRELDGFNKKDANGVTQKSYGDVFALTIANGNSLVYSMATGNKQGHIKGNSQIETTLNKRQKYKEYAITDFYTLLDGNCPIFSRVFVVPKNNAGIESLNYLLHTTQEQWREDSKEILKNITGAKADDYNPLYPYVENKNKTLYMPVYEVKEMYNIFKQGFPVSIITGNDMQDTIAHGCRVDIRFYDKDNYTLATDNIAYYEPNGYYKGKQLIKNKLDAQFIFVKDNVWQILPKRFDMKPIEFYNAVYENKIDMNKVISICKEYEKEQKNRKKIRHSKMSLTMSEDFAKDLKKAAKYKHISRSTYIKQLIAKQTREDARAYEQYLKDTRKMWSENK